jgi:hypothetical protein
MKILSKRLVHLDTPVPVFDVTINERTPCFALDAGVISHNTKRWKSPIHVIPAMSELREIYTPRTPTSLMLHADYSQAEVRTLAAMAKEAALLKAFEDGLDVHRFVASQIFKCAPGEVSSAQRRYAKAASFGILYGKGIASFARDMMGGDLTAAQIFFRDFFAAFPGVKTFIDARHHDVLSKGYVDTIFGDPIKINIRGGREDLEAAKRCGQNYPIQSSSSSLAAHSIFLLYHKARKMGMKAAPLVFTHDSCDWDIEIADVLPFLDLMQNTMVGYLKAAFGIPAAIDWEIGIHQNFTMELEKKGENTYHFSCPTPTFELIIDRMKTHFDVEYEISKTKDNYSSLTELFLTRRAFSRYLGETVSQYEGTLTLTEKLAA